LRFLLPQGPTRLRGADRGGVVPAPRGRTRGPPARRCAGVHPAHPRTGAGGRAGNPQRHRSLPGPFRRGVHADAGG
ncbi:hypothetical protein B8W90_13485, partial [Staphylococcus hominis]